MEASGGREMGGGEVQRLLLSVGLRRYRLGRDVNLDIFFLIGSDLFAVIKRPLDSTIKFQQLTFFT